MTTAMKKRSQLPRSERPEKKALNGQLRRMSERDLLAVILGSGVSGSNVKQVAWTLIRKFGEDLLTADAAALCQVRGMGEVKAARLAAAFELYRKLSDGTALRPVKTPESPIGVRSCCSCDRAGRLRRYGLSRVSAFCIHCAVVCSILVMMLVFVLGGRGAFGQNQRVPIFANSIIRIVVFLGGCHCHSDSDNGFALAWERVAGSVRVGPRKWVPLKTPYDLAARRRLLGLRSTGVTSEHVRCHPNDLDIPSAFSAGGNRMLH